MMFLMPYPVKPDDVDKKYWYRSKQFVIDNNLPITVVDVVPNFTISPLLVPNIVIAHLLQNKQIVIVR
jgi:hypothetical protein